MPFKAVGEGAQRACEISGFFDNLLFDVCQFVELPEAGEAFLAAEIGSL